MEETFYSVRFSVLSVIHHHPFTFSVRRTCATEDITFFICHGTAYDHVIKESCDFVRGGLISYATTLLSLVAMSLVEIEINVFYF